MDDLRNRVLQYLVTPGADTRFREAYLIRNVRTSAPGVSDAQVWEVLWALVADGLIYLNPSGQGSSTDNWRWLPSQHGIQVATTGQWEPRDPEGYLRRLRRYEPAVDRVAIGYVEEALRAFNARCYLATSVMLGAASERVFDGLARSALAAVGDVAQKLRQAVDNPRTSQAARFTELRKVLEPMRTRARGHGRQPDPRCRS